MDVQERIKGQLNNMESEIDLLKIKIDEVETCIRGLTLILGMGEVENLEINIE